VKRAPGVGPVSGKGGVRLRVKRGALAGVKGAAAGSAKLVIRPKIGYNGCNHRDQGDRGAGRRGEKTP
jgi:hypothetical protein